MTPSAPQVTTTSSHPHALSLLESRAYGALIYLNLPVTLGQVIVVKNPETSEEQACRVAFRNTDADGKTEVGFEFVQPALHFWRVSFPPSDWAPHHPEITGKTF